MRGSLQCLRCFPANLTAYAPTKSADKISNQTQQNNHRFYDWSLRPGIILSFCYLSHSRIFNYFRQTFSFPLQRRNLIQIKDKGQFDEYDDMVFWEKSKSKKLTNKVATKKIKYVLLQLRACSRWRPLITKSMTLKSIESFIFADFNEKLPFYYNFYSRHITLYVVELTFVFTASKKFLKQKGTIECRFSEVFGRRYRKFSSNTYRFDVFNRRSMTSRGWIHAGLAFSNKASDTLPVNIHSTHSKGINES